MPLTRSGTALVGQDRAGLTAFIAAIPNTTTRARDFVRVATGKACSRFVARKLLDLVAYGLGVGCLLVLLGATVAGWAVVLTFAALLYVPSAVAR